MYATSTMRAQQEFQPVSSLKDNGSHTLCHNRSDDGNLREARATTKSLTNEQHNSTFNTDPNVPTISRRRNVHSTISCSLYLQFALLITASCDLHRTKTLVIHHVELYGLTQKEFQPSSSQEIFRSPMRLWVSGPPPCRGALQC